MSRKVTKEQNEVSLIIGTLPKRLQNKIAASCSHATATAVEDAENAEPPMATTTIATTTKKMCPRPITILSNSSVKGKCNDKMPVLDTSGSSHKQLRDVCIPGILRVTANVSDNASATCHFGRRRGRTQDKKNKAHTPHSPQERTRLTTEHPEWFEPMLNMPNAKDIVQLYDQLMVLQHRNLILVNWKNFCYILNQLQEAFKTLMLEQLRFVCEHKVDAFFWKLLFYNVREYLKRQQTDQARCHTLLLIEQALKFYHTVFDQLMTKYASSSRCESAVKVVAQRLLICLGDLSRYRVNYVQGTDYLEAARYYHRAQELVPGNGTPYNQLAIVSIFHHKRFDAVYYYVRSLLTSNSIQTAKESLLDLFDEIRRKYEDTEMKKSPFNCGPITKDNQKSKHMRKEVWIYPDGIRCLHRSDLKKKGKNKVTLAEVNRYDEMSPVDLLPRVVSLYLYLIGKLYNGTDVDSLYQLLRKLQIQLSVALKQSNLLSRSKLVKMVALNLFVMEHNKRKVSRREMRYHSFNFANSLFGLMLKITNETLANFVEESTSVQDLADDKYTTVNTYLQFVNVHVHWLSINVDLWEPVRSEEHSFIDCWAELSTLFINIEWLLGKYKLDQEDIKKCSKTILDEDIALSGFSPLGKDTTSRVNGQRGSERIQFLVRMQKIAQFQECFLQHQDALQHPQDSSFTIEDLNDDMKVALNSFEAESCGLSEDSSSVSKPEGQTKSEKKGVICPSTDFDVSQLCKLKKELEEKARVKKFCNSKLEEILKLVDTKIYIEVRPRYLLPDTNCFIDCLEDIEKLSMEYKRYTLIIPLTVVKELDGLSKGVKLDAYRSSRQTKRIHHFDEVSTLAKKSLEFIKSAKSNVKCATTKGSFVNASVFGLVEEEYLSNDDKILATAVAVSKTTKSEQCKDGKCFIQTELVLITTDRNLRVKALTRNLAVSALEEFLQWAKDCREST
ncbi:telomerase-binding protein EST1A [Drosophila guanche]|uniref:Blast:Telomerase-binding protein EST1A n=2 Tax=Drosophila guanche TaxID=7266 RepID=A0A3B0K3T8_DROGU|nr:telomerase-binding protein EST1A [Drosophila guanche]SPP82620.1 blast:Telomerase-binding protein EST1A [Drosophila guanche]